jgi:penicillin-binding protein 1B
MPRSTARSRARSRRRGRFLRRLVLLAFVGLACAGGSLGYLYATYGAMVERRLHGERERAAPRIFARPLEIRPGQSLSLVDFVARLKGLSYAERPRIEAPGQFAVEKNTVALVPRSGRLRGRPVRVSFPADTTSRGIRAITVDGTPARRAVDVDAPLVTSLTQSGARAKQRHVRLATIPTHVQQAVLATEDQAFYSHPGVNPFRLAAAALTNVFSERRAPVGNSTLTQQLARMFFQADAFNAELQAGSRSYGRYLQGMLMSIALERRATKDEILELYLNDVYLGQRGSFAIHGVAEAARLFFGKDVANLTIAEGALIAGVIQSPATRSPFTNRARSLERRNVVIRAMEAEGHVTTMQADYAIREPLRLAAAAVDHDAPYFVDMVAQQIDRDFPDLLSGEGPVDVYTTLDMNLQRAAIDAVRRGVARVDEALARRKRPVDAQVALAAVDPRTGAILALVGGRSYNQSQFNRAVAARRQPGSVFKPFVFLAAFEAAAADGRTDMTPASLAFDEPRVFEIDGRTWEPRNFDEYGSWITWRQALAQSRNLATIHVGEQIGFDRVVAVWRRAGVGTAPRAVPSIALGVFELSPLEVAQAYTLFVNGGTVRPLKAVDRVEAGEMTLQPKGASTRQVARPDTTYLVTDMMRSVFDGGTAAAARAAGFTREAAGKTGTTNDLRDAWFVGFTPELLTVVWVGYDDNRPLGLTGSQAALPIWTDFMKTALAGRPVSTFAVPDGVTVVSIDPETGMLAGPECPHTVTEVFLVGTEPTDVCVGPALRSVTEP